MVGHVEELELVGSGGEGGAHDEVHLHLQVRLYLKIVSKDQGGGAYLPPDVFWVWFGLGFQFFLEMNCLGVIFHIQKDSRSLDDQSPPKKILTL